MKRQVILAGLIAAVAGTSMVAPAFAKGKDRGDDRRGGHHQVFNFDEIDADGDGFVTQEEIDAHRAAKFAEADTDGNGELSIEELTAMHAAKKAEREAAREEKRAEHEGERLEKMIEHADADKDGTLSADELGPKDDNAGKMFEKLDTDKDGKISKEEFEAAQKKMGDRKGGKRKGGDRK